MKRYILLALISLLAFSFLPAQARQPDAQKSPDNSTVLVIPGTGDSQSLLRKLTPLFAKKSRIIVEIPESVGSGGGIKSVLSGNNELARVARPLTDKENAQGLKAKTFALSPVVFALNPKVEGITNLSFAQILGIYSGKIQQWDSLGGGGKIFMMNREEGDSSRTLLEQLIPGFKEISAPAGSIVYSTPEALQTLMATPNTIGYLPQAAMIGTGLKELSIQDIAPSVENVRQKKYLLVVPFALVWKEPLSPRAQSFLDFLSSPAAKKLMLENGAIPVE